MQEIYDELNAAHPGNFAHDLVKAIRKELVAQKGELTRLAGLSNGAFSHSWLIAFAAGRIKTPHVDKLVSLATFLGFRFKVEAGPHFNRFVP